ncbi:hypothetical protein ABEB36_000045 [Hypothenemus hampei]|uniref:Uncharacterized protein n=1 Tax=Hypothenemus hampei TaxID=57062 RepID=A0ABD1FA31_HYPHA
MGYDGLENLAEFISYKMKEPNCKSPEQSCFTWISFLSEGGLHKPLAEFFSQMEQLGNIFKIINADTLLYIYIKLLNLPGFNREIPLSILNGQRENNRITLTIREEIEDINEEQVESIALEFNDENCYNATYAKFHSKEEQACGFKSASPHFDRKIRTYLNNNFTDLEIGKGHPNLNPPRSLCLTFLDYYLWGHTKSLVYVEGSQTTDDLINKIINTSILQVY